ncbi:MAG TPA: hypothetical protein DCQ06_13490 [Myxococcales bacterium]|nr:hypothetical protein [Myxococcales bacterium]HAN32603.1 hypothetical protein [Myxococcales bacterium]
MKVLVRLALLVLLVSSISCSKAPNRPPKARKENVNKASSPSQPSAPNAAHLARKATQTTQSETASYLNRRKIRPAVIGGCGERCRQPAGAVNALLDSLVSGAKRTGARHLFDWSLLRVDGRRLGDRWSQMWTFAHQRDQRAAEIDKWLMQWLSRFDSLEPSEIDRMRARSVSIVPMKDRTDVQVMRWKLPKRVRGTSEAEWRVLWTLRGYEWLIMRIDTSPSQRPIGAPPLGSVRPGRL